MVYLLNSDPDGIDGTRVVSRRDKMWRPRRSTYVPVAHSTSVSVSRIRLCELLVGTQMSEAGPVISRRIP